MSHDPVAAILAGRTGDPIGARRLRRSFRLCVAFAVFFVAMMWFTENFLRYEPSERLYLAALTHEPESARPLLMQAIKKDKETRPAQTPKYTEALAEREEQGKILDTYAAAYKLDPQNPFLLIRYGCRLALAERWAEAHAMFQRAAELDPKNALPAYLEAAMLPRAEPTPEALSRSIEMVARINSGNRKVEFPRPQWFSALPTGGMWYARLTREAVDESLAILYGYADLLATKAAEDMQHSPSQAWDNVFETLLGMGDRIFLTARVEPGIQTEEPRSGRTLQAIAGLHIESVAIENLTRMVNSGKYANRRDWAAESQRLQPVLQQILTFESARDERIEDEQNRRFIPLSIWMTTFAFVGICYLASYLLAKIFGVTRESWALRHPVPARIVFVVLPAVLLLMLAAITAGYLHVTPGWRTLAHVATGIWTLCIGLAVLFGPFYPLVVLRTLKPTLNEPATPVPASDNASTPKKRPRVRRVLYSSLFRRYYGILCGLVLVVGCLWVIAYRIDVSLYPWQGKLLTPGFAVEEALVIDQAVAQLQQR